MKSFRLYIGSQVVTPSRVVEDYSLEELDRFARSFGRSLNAIAGSSALQSLSSL